MARDTRRRGFHIKAKSLVRRPSTNAHIYDKDRQVTNPTNADTAHVNEHAPEPDEGASEWTFERMILQNQGQHPYTRLVHLYASTDEDGNLLERLVVKIQSYQNQVHAESKTEAEFGLHQQLTDLGCPHILKCYGYSVRIRPKPPQLGYGYMEYAPWGDLWSFSIERTHTPQIPEPFIWLVFRGLAEAVYTLSTGLVVDPNEPQTENNRITNDKLDKAPGWDTIVNADMKPANVVLADSLPDRPYKVPKMIDFGFAMSRWPKAEHRRNIGTPGYMPPEQEVLNPAVKTSAKDWARSADIGIHSMIFNIGLIILTLMENKTVIYDTPGQIPSHGSTYRATYSHQLEELAAKCVRLNPEERVKLWRLLFLTKRGLERWENVYGDVRGKSEDELLPFARAAFRRNDTVGLGEFMGSEWRVKRRKSEEEVFPGPSRTKQKRVMCHVTEEHDDEVGEDIGEEVGENSEGEVDDDDADEQSQRRRTTSQDAPGESEELPPARSNSSTAISSGNDARPSTKQSQKRKRPSKGLSKARKKRPTTSSDASEASEKLPPIRRSKRLQNKAKNQALPTAKKALRAKKRGHRAKKKALPAYKIVGGNPRLL